MQPSEDANDNHLRARYINTVNTAILQHVPPTLLHGYRTTGSKHRERFPLFSASAKSGIESNFKYFLIR